MKQSIIMNVQWDISMPMPCLNGMPIAALNNPFIKAHNWIQAEPSIDSSFSSHKCIPNYHDNTYHHYLLQCRSIGIFRIFLSFVFEPYLQSLDWHSYSSIFWMDQKSSISWKWYLSLHKKKIVSSIVWKRKEEERDSRFINIKIFVLKAGGNVSRGQLEIKRFWEKSSVLEPKFVTPLQIVPKCILTFGDFKYSLRGGEYLAFKAENWMQQKWKQTGI